MGRGQKGEDGVVCSLFYTQGEGGMGRERENSQLSKRKGREKKKRNKVKLVDSTVIYLLKCIGTNTLIVLIYLGLK